MTPEEKYRGKTKLACFAGLLAFIMNAQISAGENTSNSPRANALVGNINNDLEINIGIGIENLCPQLVFRASPDTETRQSREEKDLTDRCTDVIVDSLGGRNQQDALRQLTADEVATMRTGSIELSTAQLSRIGARLRALRTASIESPIFSIAGIESSNVPTHGDVPLTFNYQTGGGAGDEFGSWGLFVNGSIGTGDKDQTNREAGFDFDSLDLTVGVDYRLSEYGFVGVALGVGNTDADIDNNGTNSVGGQVDADGVTLTGYGSRYFPNGIYVAATAGIGSSDFETERDLDYVAGLSPTRATTPVRQAAKGDTDGDQVFASIEVGKDHNRNSWLINIAGRLDFLDGEVDGFTEQMSNPNAPGVGMALEIDDQDIESLTSTLRVQASKAISTQKGVVQPFIRGEWIHEFEDDADEIRARFAFDPFSAGFQQSSGTFVNGATPRDAPTIFIIPTDEPDEDYFRLGGGTSAQFAGGKSAFIALDILLGLEDVSSYTLSAGYRWEF